MVDGSRQVLYWRKKKKKTKSNLLGVEFFTEDVNDFSTPVRMHVRAHMQCFICVPSVTSQKFRPDNNSFL